jgi:hypothetical protein
VSAVSIYTRQIDRTSGQVLLLTNELLSDVALVSGPPSNLVLPEGTKRSIQSISSIKNPSDGTISKQGWQIDPEEAEQKRRKRQRPL